MTRNSRREKGWKWLNRSRHGFVTAACIYTDPPWGSTRPGAEFDIYYCLARHYFSPLVQSRRQKTWLSRTASISISFVWRTCRPRPMSRYVCLWGSRPMFIGWRYLVVRHVAYGRVASGGERWLCHLDETTKSSTIFAARLLTNNRLYLENGKR